MAQLTDFITARKGVTYLDLFAGAGGFSEGFLQAFTADKYYDFRLASDINENCELTHRVRYNSMLGLDTRFLRQDITEESFLDNLQSLIGNQAIDVVTGGPSCQSFSLAGRRRKLDKRDDLFFHYLKVIKALRPKYFVMENVKGILTKDGGRVGERILREIRSIVDDAKMPKLRSFMDRVLKPRLDAALYAALCLRLDMERGNADHGKINELIFNNLDQQLKDVTRHLPYLVSKSNPSVNTVRHGLLLLQMKQQREELRQQFIQLKTRAHVDNDIFTDGYNAAIDAISDESVLDAVVDALGRVADMGDCRAQADGLKQSLTLLTATFDECVDFMRSSLDGGDIDSFNALMREVHLYNIDRPLILCSADYGVPQNRERVVFIGCRNDQEVIAAVPATVAEGERVVAYEALWDLDMAGNGETVTTYKPPRPIPELEPRKLRRQVAGEPSTQGLLYSEWSRRGRLGHRFAFDEPPFHVKNNDELRNPLTYRHMELFNHQTSQQNAAVRERLRIIAAHGDYDAAKEELRNKGLDSHKRNYTVLNPTGQSPTVCTMPDDFIHYAAFRPTTVREMARLQSFDDSFVFQGKRQTGGNNRQKEIPQYTLVGNAVPPLMARAIANTILQHIK